MNAEVAICYPKVYLIGTQTMDWGAVEQFQSDHDFRWETDADDDSEAIIEAGGRVCYMSYAKPRPGGNSAYIKNILDSGHGSVLEHAVYNLMIVGISRSLTHELVRHRAGFAYSQLSQRFVPAEDAEAVIPEIFKGDPESVAVFKKAFSDCVAAYQHLARRTQERIESGQIKGVSSADKTTAQKKARQAARSVLPNATETKILVTANARAWRHFLELRGSEHAEDEIRVLSAKVLAALQGCTNTVFADLEVHEHIDGLPVIRAKYHKV